MDAMEAVNNLVHVLWGKSSIEYPITASSTEDVISATVSTYIPTNDDNQIGNIVKATKTVIESVSTAISTAMVSSPPISLVSTTPNIQITNYAIPIQNSDFILKRIAKSVGFKVAKTLADSGAPDKHIASIISYLVSPFALLCMGMAIILNRTVVFATTRRPVPLPLIYRVILRSIAIYTLTCQTIPLIRALACSNPQFGVWLIGNTKETSVISGLSRYILKDEAGIGNIVGNNPVTTNSITSSLLYSLSPWKWFNGIDLSWWSSSAINKSPLNDDSWLACPGPEILWDLYRSICIGHFIETFTSVIQGRIPYSETGMTLFEYSVAFQEVQSSQQLSTEILIVSIISSFSQLAFHIQGMLNSYKYRLIPSSIFGITFLSYFAYAVFNGRLLYFPSVCVIGYVPQLAVSIVVLICGFIYALACIFAGGPSNMQTSLSSIHIEMTEDFYSCLMKLGVIALTAATKATYLTEARSLCAPLSTWIEFVDEGGFSSNVGMKSLSFSKNPYDIEVIGPPNENGYIRSKTSKSKDIKPKELKVRNSLITSFTRIISAFRMVQALFTITLYMVWKVINILLIKILPRSVTEQDESKTRAEEFEATLMAVRNNFIYADLNDEYEGGYLTLLNGEVLPEIDDSIDYNPVESDDENGYEYASDYETEDEDSIKSDYVTSSILRVPSIPSQSTTPPQQATPKISSINEFYDLVISTPDYFLSLLAPKTSEQAEEVEILSRHLSASTPGPLTRSKYHDSNQENDLRAILQILRDRRKPKDDNNEDIAALRSTLCVVCQTSPRQIILWPCRCFALCEECRVALAFKHFKGCVCCRQEVDSFSRVYIP